MPTEDFYPEGGANLSGEGSDPTHHIVLNDGLRQLGFVITDQSGDRDERTFRRFPNADPARPYVTEKQETFGGGFGQATFEDNRSMYWRSKGVDTTKDALVLAPMFHYAKGQFRKAEEFMPTSTGQYWGWLGAGAYTWRAMPFTISHALGWASTTYLKLFLQKEGTPSKFRVRIYTNSGGAPDTLIHTEDIHHYNLTDEPDGQWVRIAIPDTYGYGYTTQYWLVLTTTTPDGRGWWRILSQDNTVGLKSLDGAVWTSGSDFFFRIEGPERTIKAKFFDYKKQSYTLVQFDSGADSELWMNGWRGAADSNTGALDRLKDSTQDWSTKITGNEVVQMVAGKASGELEDKRTVASGANGYVLVDNDWIVTHVTRDDYVITNSDWWTKIPEADLLDGRVTDVAVANGAAYICRGNNRRVTLFRHFNRSGVWTSEFWGQHVQAQFAQTVNDPISGDVLWFGYNRSEEGEYKPYVWQSVPTGLGGIVGLDLVHVAKNKGDGSGETWVASTADVTVYEDGLWKTKITVSVSEVDGVAVGAGGADYVQDEDLILVDSGSSGTAKVNIDSVDGGGAVTALTILVAGYDYTTGVKTVTGGSGTNCTINITSLGGFDTGQVAYINLYEFDDSTAETVDIRNMTNLSFFLWYDTKGGSPSELSAGDIQIQLDDTQGSGTPFAEYNVPGMQSRSGEGNLRTIALDLAGVSGAQALTSIGLKLTAAKTKTFSLWLMSDIYAWRGKKPITVGQVDGDNITGLETFGDPETAWVFTEAGFGQLKNQKFLPVPNREIKVARNSNNGMGHEVHDVYLMFTWQGRLQKYFRQNIDDLGPDFPAGMGDIAGEIVDVRTYPGRIYVAVDGGRSGKSMILCHKGGAWHEVFTSFTGERIRGLFVQSIESKSDKLWAVVGSDLIWFPITLNAAELPANSDYQYVPMGYLDMSWVYTSRRELDKVFRSLLLTMDRANDNDLDVDVYFKVDDEDSDWQKAASSKALSASTLEHLFSNLVADAVIRGNRLRVRLALRTKDITKTPTVRSVQNRIYVTPEVKFSYTWLSKLSTISINLRGDEERVIGVFATIQAAFDLIDEWSSRLIPLQVESDIGAIAGKLVVIESVPAQLLMMVHDERIQEQSIQIAANDLFPV